MPKHWAKGMVGGILATLYLTFFMFGSMFGGTAQASEFVPPRNGMSLNLGYLYDPGENIALSQLCFIRLYDYDDVWPHQAPEPLRFKVEVSLGPSRLENGDVRVNAGAGIFALYYLDGFASAWGRPYVEAGIGVTYTDYRVEEQGLRFNFNPQAGAGMEFDENNFASLRLHHVSNGGLDDDNRGMNAILVVLGRYF